MTPEYCKLCSSAGVLGGCCSSVFRRFVKVTGLLLRFCFDISASPCKWRHYVPPNLVNTL